MARGGQRNGSRRDRRESGSDRPRRRPDLRAAAAPADVHAASTVLMAALERGDYAAAADALDILAAAEPDNAALHYNRALALRLSGRPRDGFDAARRARALDPANGKAVFEVCACGLECGEPQASLEAGTAYLAVHPGDADAALNSARAALLLDRPEDALALLGQVPANQLSDDHRLCRGEALRDLSRFDEAECAWAHAGSASAGLVLSLRTKGPRGRLALNPARLSP
ncbi:tetratricopeptide repeat protein [Jiella mangrovi]|uniref:Tetratricopeptide repeat protein n=1 Tax=Jiella mangrovi TaxID=2821407 RepID=A0ABS4BN80_9HYPH|nr:tetratricopeptide repeat protein [Jiella mangrovi]MBP0618106.1 hypothetical protein [Jiella mangrovi]